MTSKTKSILAAKLDLYKALHPATLMEVLQIAQLIQPGHRYRNRIS